MSFKKFRRIFGAVFLAGVCAVVPAFCGCNTDHPEAEITISFDDKEYVLEYKLYRNMYPQTVQHFIELADNGFYDGTFVHDYTTSQWYTGGYAYVAGYNAETNEVINTYDQSFQEGVEGFREYLEEASLEKRYEELADPAAGKITPTVYKDYIDGKLSQPLNTLIGEFSNNQHKIENGALKQSFGCLKMYYTSKSSFDSVKNVRVYLDKQGSSKGVTGSYNYNSATSIFSIQANTSTSADSSYCIFAVLQNSQALTDLKSAVSAYSSKVTYSKFTKDVSLYVDNCDEYVGANVNEDTLRATSKPIIIKTVKITKY